MRTLSHSVGQSQGEVAGERNNPRPAFPLVRGCSSMVGDTGFEPVTSSVSRVSSCPLPFEEVRLSTSHSPTVPRRAPRSVFVVTHLVTHLAAQLGVRRARGAGEPGRPVDPHLRQRRQRGGRARGRLPEGDTGHDVCRVLRARPRVTRGAVPALRQRDAPADVDQHQGLHADLGAPDQASSTSMAKSHHQPIIDAVRTGDVDRARACLRLTWRPQPTSGARRPRRPDGGGALRRLPLQSAPCVDHGPSCAAPRFPLSG